jgi:uncharacterized phiE125 gp8 family phage protein
MLISDTLKTAPTSEPVSITDLAYHLRMTAPLSTEDTALLTRYISAAREFIEGQTGRAMVTQTRTACFREFPTFNVREGFYREAYPLIFGRAPLASVTSIKYLDATLTEQTLASANYFVDTMGEQGAVCLKPGCAWPSVGVAPNAVRIEYICGVAAASVPATLQQAVLFLAAHFYENAAPVNIGNIVNELPFTLKYIIWANHVH